MGMSEPRSVIVTCLTALGLCGWLTGCATHEQVEQQPPPVAADAGSIPATLPPEEPGNAQALRKLLTRTGSMMRVIRRPDGLTQIDTLQGFHSAMVARRAEHGRIEQSCVHTPEELDDMQRHSVGAQP